MNAYPNLYKYIHELTTEQKHIIKNSLVEDYEDEDIKNEKDLEKFIIDNLILYINLQTFEFKPGTYGNKEKTEKEVINWCFDKLLENKANSIKSGIKPNFYYNCLINALSYTIKDIVLLDSMDRMIWNEMGYVSADKLKDICDTFNIAIRVRAIEPRTNMIEFGNKANKGWYGNPDKAKYCCEIARIEHHYIPWIEDIGITEYYLDHMEEINKYAKSHNWNDNKRLHTYKKSKNNFKADEKKKGMNVLRLIKKFKEIGAFEPITRDDIDYVELLDFIKRKLSLVHTRC